ncbi:hypothetical protein G6F22_020809 [Rhizopus arrhizus]|nr:hypothetical protein G6F22_020809 [Rhizopus arrhizus]
MPRRRRRAMAARQPTGRFLFIYAAARCLLPDTCAADHQLPSGGAGDQTQVFFRRPSSVDSRDRPAASSTAVSSCAKRRLRPAHRAR